LDEPSAISEGQALPEQVGSVQVQKKSDPAVSGPVERPQTADEPTPLLVVQETSQQSALIQRRNSDKRHPTTTANEGGEQIRKEGYVQDPFPDISWEGWGLIKTPGGLYLPETFNPFSHVFEDLTDQW
jgi:hypothetical protein